MFRLIRRSTDLCVKKCVDYEEISREVKTILIYECRCNARLKSKDEGSTRLGYTGLYEGLGREV